MLQLSLVAFLLYIVAQTVGSLIGAGLLKAFLPDGNKSNLGTPGLSPGISQVILVTWTPITPL